HAFRGLGRDRLSFTSRRLCIDELRRVDGWLGIGCPVHIPVCSENYSRRSWVTRRLARYRKFFSMSTIVPPTQKYLDSLVDPLLKNTSGLAFVIGYVGPTFQNIYLKGSLANQFGQSVPLGKNT